MSTISPRSSADGGETGLAPKDRRDGLDDVDRVLVAALAVDARITNKELAERAGVAPSTCLGRVRALEEAGVLRGYHADVDLRRLGREIEAMVFVRVQPQARGRVDDIIDALSGAPQVIEAYYLAGASDLMLRVVAHDTAELRRFVTDQLGRDAAVVATETSVVLRHVRDHGLGL